MKRAPLLLVLGIVVAVLLWRGPAVVDQAVAFVMRALGKKEEANRQALIPSARAALDSLRLELEQQHGIKTFVGSTRRTPAEQAVKVEANLSTTNNSWHLLGRAVDLYPIDPKTGQWDSAGRTWDTLFRKMHELAPRHGWRGLAFNPDGSRRYLVMRDGSRKWDGPHLEFPEGMTFAQAQRKGAAA